MHYLCRFPSIFSFCKKICKLCNYAFHFATFCICSQIQLFPCAGRFSRHGNMRKEDRQAISTARRIGAFYVPPNYPGENFGAFVGADIIRPVVFPTEKQRRRKAPTMQCRTFSIEILRHNVETWYIGNIGTQVWPIRFCPKICHVGGRMISAPTTHRNFRAGILPCG